MFFDLSLAMIILYAGVGFITGIVMFLILFAYYMNKMTK